MLPAVEGSLSSEIDRISSLLGRHPGVSLNPSRRVMIEKAVENREAVVSACGALAVWTPPDSTGRSPKNTFLVKRPGSAANIDWNSPNNLPVASETFDMLLDDALAALQRKPHLYVTDRLLGADPSYSLPVRVIADQALTALFTDNMFRPVVREAQRSVLHKKGFTVLAVPYEKLDPARYAGRIPSTMAVAIDFDRRLGVVYGSAYCGTIKKMLFTVMNYLLPQLGILSLHASANEGSAGDAALLLGLSGTGKTTLSADPRRWLLGDDEHGWSDGGVANFEYGCYAKLVRLDPTKEPEIHRACFHKDDWRRHGAIIENALMYPNGRFDLNDTRLTPNSRGSFLLSKMSNIKDPPLSGHPKTILFLTADANGVLPPVSRLTRDQAMLWFLMGYTSKLEGTETGIKEPVATFSRFFGSPFMPLQPEIYSGLLGKKLEQHGTKVYLINTGWSGGPYGIGKRIDIDLTRTMVEAALSGALEHVETVEDPVFHLQVPKSCPGVLDPRMLHPRETWADVAEYDRRAAKLAAEFAAAFDKQYNGKGIPMEVEAQCPGK